VPLPPQTPHASTTEPAAQQPPAPSMVAGLREDDAFSPIPAPPPAQHLPSASTTPLVQHSREASATPEAQPAGTSQKAPDAPSRQTHRPPSHSPRPEQAAAAPREACAAQKSHATAPQACEEAGCCWF